jgi:hypothetical protein
VLRKGLLHERWGQHAGALAHLLALGLFAREGFGVVCEPDLGNQSPDLLASKAGADVLVEVRAITGCGRQPWTADDDEARRLLDDDDDTLDDDDDPLAPDIDPALAAALRARLAPPPASAGGDGRRPRGGRDGRRAPRGRSEKAERARARRRAAERAKAALANQADLGGSVLRVLEKKAAAYKDLCTREELPYVICVYQDTDTQIPAIVCDWAFGEAAREQAPDGGWHSIHDPAEGVFFGDRWHFGHVSAVLVFGRTRPRNPLP